MHYLILRGFPIFLVICKNPLDYLHDAVRFYADSSGRKWVDVLGDTVDVEVKE